MNSATVSDVYGKNLDGRCASAVLGSPITKDGASRRPGPTGYALSTSPTISASWNRENFFEKRGIFLLTGMVAMVILTSMEKVIIQTRDVPADLHHRFKVLCAESKVSMNAKTIELIREYVEREEKRKK